MSNGGGLSLHLLLKCQTILSHFYVNSLPTSLSSVCVYLSISVFGESGGAERKVHALVKHSKT